MTVRMTVTVADFLLLLRRRACEGLGAEATVSLTGIVCLQDLGTANPLVPGVGVGLTFSDKVSMGPDQVHVSG